LVVLFSATKGELIRYLKAKDLEFVTLFNKRLLPSSDWLLTQKIGASLVTSQDDAVQVIADIGGQLPVTKRVCRQFTSQQPLSNECIDIYCKLFQSRDDRIAETHHDVNHERATYQKYGRTLFLGNSFYDTLTSVVLEPDHIAVLIQQNFPTNWKLEDTLFIMLLIKCSVASEEIYPDSWSMIRIDLMEHKIDYCDPRIDKNINPMSEFSANSLQTTTTNVLIPMLRVVLPTYEGNWPIKLLDNQYFLHLLPTNQNDCGIYLIACVYFLVQQVPISFNQGSIKRFRKQFAYWILCGSLPF